MPTKKENVLLRKKAIIEEHKRHYIEGVTTYVGIWRTWIYPKFFISYNYYMDILGEPNLEHQLEAERRKEEEDGV